MGIYLVPLLAGFTFNAASAFTAAFSRRWGARRGQLVTAVLRNVLGIPVWVTGILLAVRHPSAPLFAASRSLTAVAWGLLGLGSLLQLWALAALRSRAALPSIADSLVERGPYALLRHPIYAGLLVQLAGLVLDRPRRAVALACGLAMCWTVLQARLEELDLVQRLPAYRAYMTRVPRFIPRPRRGS